MNRRTVLKQLVVGVTTPLALSLGLSLGRNAGAREAPLRVIVPFPPGGGTDVLARALQDKIEAALGAQLIIDNRGGAGGTLGTALAAKAEPDGCPVLVATNTGHRAIPTTPMVTRPRAKRATPVRAWLFMATSPTSQESTRSARAPPG